MNCEVSVRAELIMIRSCELCVQAEDQVMLVITLRALGSFVYL